MQDQTPHKPNSTVAAAEKRLVALTSVIAAVGLTGMKLVVGFATGSLGILSEALHSALDLVAAVITLFAVRVSARPADQRHPFGHGKFENLSAFFETLLLLATCVWIIVEAYERLFFKVVPVEATVWSFVAMAISIVVDVSRSRALSRVARKYNSQALEADALHFSTDVWSSSVVLGGLACVRVGAMFNLPWLAKADAIAALGVAGIVVWVSIQLGRKTIADLLDEVPANLVGDIRRAVMVDGVIAVKKARVRRSGPESFVDVSLQVEPGTTLLHGHKIADAAEAAVQNLLPGADVVVHVEPSDTPPSVSASTLTASVREIAAGLGLAAHDVYFHEVMGVISLELHLEVSDALDVAAAHDQAHQFEAALRIALPTLGQILTHIEPVASTPSQLVPEPELQDRVQAIVNEITHGHDANCAPHEVTVARQGNKLLVSLHCTMDPTMSITTAHELTEKVEDALRQRLPELDRVVIHVEPK